MAVVGFSDVGAASSVMAANDISLSALLPVPRDHGQADGPQNYGRFGVAVRLELLSVLPPTES